MNRPGTAIKTRNGPNGEVRHFMGCWAIFANNCYIPNIDDDDVRMTADIIRVNQIPLDDMLHNSLPLQGVFEYKSIHCYCEMVPSIVPGHPDELEKLTIYGTRISATGPSIRIMYDGLRKFPYDLTPEAMQEIKKIMRATAKNPINMESHWRHRSRIYLYRYVRIKTLSLE